MTTAEPVVAAGRMRQIMMQFEALGEDCEFGLAQRAHKAEPLGLLRFASAPLQSVTALIEAELDQFAQPGSLTIRLAADGTYYADEMRYRISYHTFVREGQLTPQALLEREHKRLRYLAAKMLDDLENAEKTFVYKRTIPLAAPDIVPLYRALRRFGPNRLLWVALADKHHPAGSVELTDEGLMCGYIDHFSNSMQVPLPLSVEVWTQICSNAWGLCCDGLCEREN
jgi:hypothetical protein